MSDHDLLVFAAKAAGLPVESQSQYIKVREIGDSEDSYLLSGKKYFVYGEEWNPLEDDGDAFRLAVRLRIEVIHDVTSLGDPFLAYRRAIVRAAAEIGRAMP